MASRRANVAETGFSGISQACSASHPGLLADAYGLVRHRVLVDAVGTAGWRDACRRSTRQLASQATQPQTEPLAVLWKDIPGWAHGLLESGRGADRMSARGSPIVLPRFVLSRPNRKGCAGNGPVRGSSRARRNRARSCSRMGSWARPGRQGCFVAPISDGDWSTPQALTPPLRAASLLTPPGPQLRPGWHGTRPPPPVVPCRRSWGWRGGPPGP